MEKAGENRFEVEGKSREWHTAFYYLAEHVRLLSRGSINHKGLYSLVGVDGRYVNHENPLVRKRTAGALSRIVHSRRYMDDMRTRFEQNCSAFDNASALICDEVLAATKWPDDELFEYLCTNCWADVRRGLENEVSAWRNDTSMFRVDREMLMLVHARDGRQPREFDLEARDVLSAILYVLAFGHMEFDKARSLADCDPTGSVVRPDAICGLRQQACLVKFSDGDHSAIMGLWAVSPDRPFTIGRYTDCDIVEADPNLSRLHCCFYFRSGTWYFEDMGSHNGSRVIRGRECVYDCGRDGANVAVPLAHGDGVVLADSEWFWFGAMAGVQDAKVIRGRL